MKKNGTFKKIIGLMILSMISSCGSPTSSTPPSSSEEPVVLDQILETTVVTYEGPELLTTSELASISVNEHNLFVYEVNVNHRREFSWTNDFEKNAIAYFDFEGRVTIEISLPYAVNAAKVSPLAYEISPTITGNSLSFIIEQPANYVIEINDDSTKVIHLFANPLEKDIPNPDDENVVYLAPGLYDAGSIPLTAGQTLYISGGAYVYGSIRTELIDDITIRGRGIISGEIYSRLNQSDVTVPLEIRSGNNITIEGIILLDPAGWATTIYNSDNVLIDNVKIITSRPNGDGISLQGSRDVVVKGGFVRSWDDSLVVKNNDGHVSENVLFDGTVVWTDLAQSMEVGFETHGEYIRNVEFKNITVVYNFHKAAISMHNADIATISDVRYRNITIENAFNLGDNQNDGENDFLIDLSIEYSRDWSTSTDLGDVSNVLIENVKVLNIADTVVSRIRGYEGNNATISNVTIRDIEIDGSLVKNEDDLKLVKGNNVNAITVESQNAVSGAHVAYTYDLANLDENINNHEEVPATAQSAVIVPDFAFRKGGLPYLGEPLSISAESVNVTHGTGITFLSPADDGSGSYDSTINPLANILDNNEETNFVSKSYTGEENEFIALEINFAQAVFAGSVRLIAPGDNVYSYKYNIEVRYKKKNSSGEYVNYTIASGLKAYTISPSQGNAIDISFNASDIKGLQIRMFRYENNLFSLENINLASMYVFGPSLSYRKPIVDSTEYADVYDPARLTDGEANGTSYYESASLPAHIVIDLRDVYTVNSISLHLPALLSWTTRNQEIELFASDSNLDYSASETTFTSIMTKRSLTFDPTTGNMNLIELSPTVSMRYLKIVIYSNDIAGGYMAQLSEVYVFGSK
ncbi:MAG: glycosyl hydrolase family 28 protein [Bacilli bacterium]|jgi:hypothetical protein|nr:glycosyl hydrolase family 28 protein [Bacilli bacterium]